MQIKKSLTKIINDWQEYFKDKQKLILMILLLFFLPMPSLYIVMIGITPALYSFIFGFYIMEELGSGLDTLLGILMFSGLAFLHLIGYMYLYRLFIFLFYKLVNLLKSFIKEPTDQYDKCSW